MCVCVCVFVELSCTLDWITSGSPASPLSLLCVGSAKRRIFETNKRQNVQNTLWLFLFISPTLFSSPPSPPPVFSWPFATTCKTWPRTKSEEEDLQRPSSCTAAAFVGVELFSSESRNRGPYRLTENYCYR